MTEAARDRACLDPARQFEPRAPWSTALLARRTEAVHRLGSHPEGRPRPYCGVGAVPLCPGEVSDDASRPEGCESASSRPHTLLGTGSRQAALSGTQLDHRSMSVD